VWSLLALGINGIVGVGIFFTPNLVAALVPGRAGLFAYALTLLALDAMLGWLQRLYQLDKAVALAVASPVVDLRVTQVANQAWGVHALLPHGAIA